MSHGDEVIRPVSPERAAAFLRSLAERAERDPRFAAGLADCLAESGMLGTQAGSAPREGGPARPRRVPGAGRRGARDSASDGALDPFALWRAQGESATRAALDALDLAQLRVVVRAHRLDPARVSARWTARDRVIALIVEQVKARLNHGRAFERV